MIRDNLKKRDSGEIFVQIFAKQIVRFIDTIKSTDIVQFVGLIFIMYAGNSYFGLPMFDSQPFPILIAILFLLFRTFEAKGGIKTPAIFLLIGGLIVAGILVGAYYEFSANILFIRGVINYGSIVIYMIAFYEYIKQYGFPIKALVFINVLWLLVALVQMVGINPVKFFVAERTSVGRGVTSLGPEPSSFGFYLFFISWIYLLVTDYKPPLWIKVLIGINLFSIFFIAVSALTVVFLIITTFFYFVINIKKFLNIRNFLILIVGLIGGYILLETFLKGSRMQILFTQLLSLDLLLVIELDESFRSRLLHVILPIYLFFIHAGLPLGFQSFANNSVELLSSFDEIFFIRISDDKIMSWNATMFYELGIFGVLIWILIYLFLTNGTTQRIGELSLLFVLLLASVPLSYPLIPLIFVIMYMTNKRHQKLKKKVKSLH